MSDNEYHAALAEKGWVPSLEFCQEGPLPWCSSAEYAFTADVGGKCNVAGWGASLGAARRTVLARIGEREALRKPPA